MAFMAIVATPAMAQSRGSALGVCIARVAPGTTARDMVAAPGRFDCVKPQSAFGAGDFWAISPPMRRTGPLAVRIASLWEQRITLHALYADGAIVSSTLDQHGTTHHIQLGAIIEQALPARAAPVVRLLWHVEGAANLRGILRDVRVVTPQSSARSNVQMAALYAGFGGLCIALICYNFALWLALRYRFQLAYCALGFALLLYAFSSSGALAWAWPWIANNDRLRINYLMLGLSAVAAFAFARAFFEPRVFAGRLGQCVSIASGIMLAATFGFALFAPYDPWLFDSFYSIAMLVQMAVLVPMLWRAWWVGSRYLWVFGFAWAAPIALACLRVANAFNLVGWSFWLNNSTIVTMTIEALLSSVAVAYRIRLLSVERDAAREGEIAARLLANTDPLTGLLNRRAFLQETIGRSGEQTLMIADLDHFKRINETIGHDGGDEVLRIFARTLRQALPPEAIIARMGGEEFAIVAPAETEIEPRDILAHLRASRMPYDLTVTASIGTCSGPLLRESDWKALYACADRALFDAKTAGRDRVRDRVLADRRVA